MKVHKYVFRRLLQDECDRFIGRYGKNPLTGLKQMLDQNKVKYTTLSEDEIIVVVGEKKIRLVQEN